MQRSRKHHFAVTALALLLAIIFGAIPVLAAPSAQNDGATGTVLVGTLNVRDQPGTTGKIVGRVTYGTQVEILDTQDGWLQIKYTQASGGKGWVSARYVSTGRQRTPSPTQSAYQAPTPSIVNYSIPNFQWTWPAARLDGVDWYFDIQVFQNGASKPYKTIVADPDKVTVKNGVYSYDAGRAQIKCDSYWQVQIAKRENGRFVGWISDTSNTQSIGGSCSRGGGSSGGSGGGSGGGNSGVPGDLDGDGVCDIDCGGTSTEPVNP